MVAWGRRLEAAGERVRSWFFPELVPLTPELEEIFGVVYPRLDRRRCSFHRGFPHFIKLSPNQAITLPATFSTRQVRVYIHPDYWKPESVRGRGLFLHEAFHILQVQDVWQGRGLGFLRPFTVLYFACGAANRFRYDGHPMETDAYRIAGYPSSLFEQTASEPFELAHFCGSCDPVVTAASGIDFWGKLVASTPGFSRLAAAARRLGGPVDSGTRLRWLLALIPALPLALVAFLGAVLWLFLWTAAAAFVGLAQGLVEVVGAAAFRVLSLAGKCLSRIGL
jgi:hypothetical protein